MPAEPTVISTNSKAQDSRVLISNLAGQALSVASLTAMAITFSSTTGITGKSLYASGTPGQLVILKSAAGASNHGKIADITAFSGDVATVDVDFTTGSALAAGDVVAVLPPLAAEIFTNGGHTLALSMDFDESKGLGQTFLTHTTRLGARVQGDIPFYLTSNSEGVLRLLLAGVGGYDKSGTSVHDFVPYKSGTTDIDQVDDLTVFSKDGNGTVQQAFYGCVGTQLTIDVPQGGTCTGSLSVLGSGWVREIGGAGKAFTTGSNNWIPTTTQGDLGNRHSYRGAAVELGGAFGDASSTSNIDRHWGSATITVTRSMTQDVVLGNEYIMKPIETEHMITVTGTRFLENDTAIFERYVGGSTAAGPGEPQTTRLLMNIISAADPTKKITLDIPKGHFTVTDIQRELGRIKQSYTFTAVHTLTANDLLDTTKPLYRLRYTGGPDIELGTAL